jgi:hypothetical protein
VAKFAKYVISSVWLEVYRISQFKEFVANTTPSGYLHIAYIDMEVDEEQIYIPYNVYLGVCL